MNSPYGSKTIKEMIIEHNKSDFMSWSGFSFIPKIYYNMIFTSIIIIIFNSFIFLIENLLANNLFAFEIAFCWFTWIGILAYKIKNIFNVPEKEKKINLNVYKLHKPKLSIFLVLLYITCFIIILFLFKVYKSVREVSLKKLYFEVLNFFSSLDFGQKVCTILFLLTLIYLAILFVKRLKNLIFYQIIKVHLYFCSTDLYINYIIVKISLYCHMTLENAIVRFFRSQVTYLNKKNWFFYSVCFLIENLVFILIVTFVSFDIYFNDFVLNKVFYILPLCFLYSQYLYLSRFYTSKEILLDDWIHKYLYTKIVFEDENIIIFEDGSEIDSETLKIIDNYIKKGFRTY